MSTDDGDLVVTGVQALQSLLKSIRIVLLKAWSSFRLGLPMDVCRPRPGLPSGMDGLLLVFFP